MTISFIIPAYNASSTIARCVDSIYNLNLKESDFEVIVVDDCSTDNTVEVVVCYAERHDNLILLQQPENHRQGAARNRGISIAKGEYIAFVDSDDMTDTGVLSAIETARRLSLDMIAMNYKYICVDGTVQEKTSLKYDDDEIFAGVDMQIKHPYWCSGPVPYLYKLAFLKNVNYPFAEDVLYEDSDFVSVHLFNAKRMSYCKECGYKVFENQLSTTHRITFRNVADYFMLGTRMLRFYSSLDDKDYKYASDILEGGSYNVYMAFKRLWKLPSFRDIKSAYDRIDEYYNRENLLLYREPKYCWTWWTRLCLKHKNISILIASVGMIVRKLLIKNKLLI